MQTAEQSAATLPTMCITCRNAGGAVVRGKNAGGGVFVRGTFIMSGGEISGNTASNNGGGVCKGRGGTFNANGGTVSGNSPDNVYNVP